MSGSTIAWCTRTWAAIPTEQTWNSAWLVLLAAGVLCVAAVSEPSAQPLPDCAPTSEPICRTMAQPEFLSAYRAAYAQTSDPADAVDDVRDNFRRAMLGAGQAGPAAVGRQIDAMLDDALTRTQQRMCGNSAALADQSVTAVAAGLAIASEVRGTRLAPGTLGAMTGVTVGATRARGVTCLCSARIFSAIRDTCAPVSSPR
jgi:hypothetical protein